jgi:hypothetical protein
MLGKRWESFLFTMKAFGLLLLLGLRLVLAFELCLGLVVNDFRLGAVAFGLRIGVVDDDTRQSRSGSIGDGQIDGKGKGSTQQMLEFPGHLCF